MGSWKGTCAISNLHIHARQDVVVFLLAKNQSEQTFCYSNALYEPCLIPFYGEYDDYGAVENCQGPGLPIILEEMHRQLYEFGQGPNSLHDCVVKRNNFNIELLFKADHEDRLGIEQFDSWNQDEYDIRRLEEMQNEEVLTNDQKFELDRLFSKLKKKDNFRRVTHVTIHREVFNDIIENFYIRDYVGAGKGNQGYNNSYRTVYFKDIVKDIPAYIASLKEEEEKFKASDDPGFKIFRKYGSNHYDRDDPNLAKKWMNSFERREGNTIVDIKEHVFDQMEAGKWDELELFVKEALTGVWINTYMSLTRKIWTQTSGKGSQNDEHLGYEVLANSVLRILESERKEREEWDREDPDEDDE